MTSQIFRLHKTRGIYCRSNQLPSDWDRSPYWCENWMSASRGDISRPLPKGPWMTHPALVLHEYGPLSSECLASNGCRISGRLLAIRRPSSASIWWLHTIQKWSLIDINLIWVILLSIRGISEFYRVAVKRWKRSHHFRDNHSQLFCQIRLLWLL